MQQRILNILTQIRGRWQALGRGTQIRIAAAALILVLALSATIFYLTRPKFVVIEANMDPAQLAQAVQTLESNGIKTDITNNTTTLSVPAESVNDARLLLATSGIKTTEMTYENALSLSIGTPESTRNMVKVQAKETEIENSISMLNNVKSARVMLSIPDATPFVLRDQDMPSASVILETTGEMSQAEAEAIAFHVSKSVQNLKMENVSILDTNNRLIYQSGADGIAGSMSRTQELEAAKKKEIENQVRALLSPRYDLVDVMATLDFDWTGETRTSTTYSPFNQESGMGIPSTQSLTESTVENSEPADEPGYMPNSGQVPEYPTGTGGSSNASSTSSDTQYAIDTETRHTESIPGRWLPENSSISINVYIDRVYREDDLAESGQLDNMTWEDFKTNTMLSPVAIDLSNGEAQNTVVGATRIQNVTIYGYERPVFMDSEQIVRPINQYLMAGLLLLLIALLAFGLIRRTQPVEITEIEPELSVEELLVSSAAQEPKIEEVLPEIDYFAESELKKQIDKFVDEKPEAAAQLLRNWLSEEWE